MSKCLTYAQTMPIIVLNGLIPLKMNFLLTTTTGLDDLGLVNKVTQVISNTNNVNISRMFDSNDGTFEGHVLLKVKNIALLKKMINQLQNINGVHKVVRE